MELQDLRFFAAMKIQLAFWGVKVYSDVVGCQVSEDYAAIFRVTARVTLEDKVSIISVGF